MIKRIAIVGGGIAGLTAAWQIAQMAGRDADVQAKLFEGSHRLGGIVETVREQGFIVECGPDAWVSEKPWARDLVKELGLGAELLPSNDATRRTLILIDGHLQAMPDGMRMMVPTSFNSLDRSSLFSASAKRAYHDELARAEELKTLAPTSDESVASFTRRHFGEEVLRRIAAPLLSGVLGGDVETLSVQAVMPQFVAMEREHGSLIAALRERSALSATPIFTTLRSGLGTLMEHLVASIPLSWLHLNAAVTAITRSPEGWRLHGLETAGDELFDAVFLAVPPHVARKLIRPLDARAADLMEMDASSAILVALGYLGTRLGSVPQGFGFLVPAHSQSELLACTFVDQKFDARVPPDSRMLRAFFGGNAAEALLSASDEQLVGLAEHELSKILGPLPKSSLSIVRRWPQSLPQYAVGHLARMAALDARMAALPGLTLLGNGYRGVGLPDLIRDARAAARRFTVG